MLDVPYGYCHCGCGGLAPIAKKTDASSGRVKGRPQRYIIGHQGRKSATYVVEDRGYLTPCWIWQGAMSGSGYGAITENGHTRQAHRVMYERVHGPVRAPGLDHLCRVRACVNPDHVEPVTTAENTRRGLSAKLTMHDAEDIRALAGAGWRGVDIAEAFGVSQQLVCDIKKGRKWVAV